MVRSARETLVDAQRPGVIAERDGGLCLAKRCRDREIARGLALLEGIERVARRRGTVQAQLREALVVRRVVGQRTPAERRAAGKRQRALVVAGRDLGCRVRERSIECGRSCGRRRLRGDEPHVARRRGQWWMRRWRELPGTARAHPHERRQEDRTRANAWRLIMRIRPATLNRRLPACASVPAGSRSRVRRSTARRALHTGVWRARSRAPAG